MSNEKGRQDYLVLARKYRPTTFEDLYGQEALVTTLSNAISSKRLHHAYILNGIRGTGKTTTARILAKVLNCENGPSIKWEKNDPNCLAIEQGNHVDVLEFDAASHTGVDDIKELFEGVNYAPVQGRYKVYIIDEVHMLSKQAFNALLKTLEEPPSYVKFIFATTEVNKIPVTVLSRCQRFDLKRIKSETLFKLFEKILKQENVAFEESALHAIAKAADGSARDGLSLLDQAIALCSNEKITEELISKMLGQAEKIKIYNLLETLLCAKPEEMLKTLEELYENGFDPILILSDLLKTLHLITRLKVVPKLQESKELSEIEKTKGFELSQKIGMENLARAYQMLQTALNEAKQAQRPYEAVEMALIRTAHLAPLPAIETIITAVQEGSNSSKKPLAWLANTSHEKQTHVINEKSVTKEGVVLPEGLQKPHPLEQGLKQPYTKINNAEKTIMQKWRELIKSLSNNHELLAETLTQRVFLINFKEKEITIYIENEGLQTPKELLNSLKKVLTNYKFNLSDEKSGKTLKQVKEEEAKARVEKAKTNKQVKQILEAFPEAQILKVLPK